MTIILAILFVLVIIFLLLLLIGSLLITTIDRHFNKTENKRAKANIQRIKQMQLEAKKRNETIETEFCQKARLLQPKFENSGFCELLAKFVFENYFLATCNSKEESVKLHTISLEKDNIYIWAGASLDYVNIEYQNLNDDFELMACAYALQSKLEQLWGNDTTITLKYCKGGYGDDSRVSICGFKIKELKKV